MTTKTWKKVSEASEIPVGLGACAKFDDLQIAVFHYAEDEWYAIQNLCPHKNQMVLSRGLVGDSNGEPKVACPLHKNNFSLKSGEHIGGDGSMCVKTYEVKVEDGVVFVEV